MVSHHIWRSCVALQRSIYHVACCKGSGKHHVQHVKGISCWDFINFAHHHTVFFNLQYDIILWKLVVLCGHMLFNKRGKGSCNVFYSSLLCWLQDHEIENYKVWHNCEPRPDNYASICALIYNVRNEIPVLWQGYQTLALFPSLPHFCSFSLCSV